MLFKMETPKQFERVCQDLEKAAVNNQFGVVAVHNLNETMKKKGVEFNRPCRVSVFMEEDKVIPATLKPTAIVSMFKLPELRQTAQEVEDTLIQIMKEASS